MRDHGNELMGACDGLVELETATLEQLAGGADPGARLLDNGNFDLVKRALKISPWVDLHLPNNRRVKDIHGILLNCNSRDLFIQCRS